jgi:hypothetical protein
MEGDFVFNVVVAMGVSRELRKAIRRVSLEGKVLLGINFADCFLTALLVHLNLAVEFNPLVALLIKQGMGIAVAGKIAIIVILVALLEFFRNRYPGKLRYIRIWQRIGIVCYILEVAVPGLIFSCL